MFRINLDFVHTHVIQRAFLGSVGFSVVVFVQRKVQEKVLGQNGDLQCMSGMTIV